MSEIFSRNEIIWGKDFQKSLSQKCILIAGLGGVGGYALEALARCGIGNVKIVDFDTVEKTNINRQLVALNSTLEKSKVDMFETRLKDINPNINIEKFNCFYSKEINDKVFENTDFVIDAIDTMKYKIELIESAIEKGVKIISAFGAGNRIDPTKLKIVDISEIQKPNCQFSKNILYQLNKRGITSGVTAVISEEPPLKPATKITNELPDGSTKIQVGSCIFVPAVMGYYMAYQVIQELQK